MIGPDSCWNFIAQRSAADAAEAAARCFDELARQHAHEEREHARVELHGAPPRRRQRRFAEVLQVRLRAAARRIDIGSVDGEARDQLAQRRSQQAMREVRGARVLASDARGIARQHVDLARHLVAHDLQLRLVHDVDERLALVRELAVEPRQRHARRRDRAAPAARPPRTRSPSCRRRATMAATSRRARGSSRRRRSNPARRRARAPRASARDTRCGSSSPSM